MLGAFHLVFNHLILRGFRATPRFSLPLKDNGALSSQK